VPPVLYVALRFALAAIILAALRPLAGRLPGVAGVSASGSVATARGEAIARRAGIVLGLLLAVSYTTQTIGLHTTTASNSAFISSLSVVLVPLVVAVRWRRFPDGATLAGLTLAVAGLILLARPRLSGLVPGDLWTLVCAVAYAIYLAYLNAALEFAPYFSLLLWQVVTVAASTLAWAFAVERGRLELNGTVWLSLAVTTLLSTVLALFLQNRYQGRTTATRAGLLFASEPVFATVFAALLLGEGIPAGWGAGAALILTAVVLIELTGRRREGAP
jgi:drug/metabolite transporter (DMT)-like permease